MDPVLRAVAMLSVDEQKQLEEIIFNSYTTARKPLVDNIVLMLNFDKAVQDWIRKQAGHLQGRSVIVAVAEFESIKGGLGRVIKYYVEFLKRFGADLKIIQPRFRGLRNAAGNFIRREDGAPFGIKIENEHPITDREFETLVGGWGQKVKLRLYEGVYKFKMGDQKLEIPVYSYEDIPEGDQKPFLGVLYEHSTDASPATEVDINIFLSKAADEVFRYIEVKRKEQLGEAYKPAILDAHDGQMLPMFAWLAMFYINPLRTKKVNLESQIAEKMSRGESISAEEQKEFQYIKDSLEVIENGLYSATTHTYPNRVNLHDGLEILRREGVPDEWLWLFLRREFDRYIWDFSSSGIRSAIGLGGTAKGVAGIHGLENGPKDPGIEQLPGIANGDNLEFTSEFFRRFLGNLPFSEYFRITPEQGAAAKAAAKAGFIVYRYADEDSLHELPGKELLEITTLSADQLVVSSSVRGVGEKLGRETAYTNTNIDLMTQDGTQLVLMASEQPFDKSRNLIQGLSDLRKRLLNSGNSGKFFLFKYFSLEDQRRLLAATDLQIQPSDRFTEAAGASEAHAPANFALQMGPPYWEGILNRIGSAVNWVKGTGSVVVPSANTPEAYLAAVMKVNQEFRAGRLTQYQWQALQTSRVYSASLTVASFLRFWNKALDKPRPKTLKPRIPGEVRLSQIDVKFARKDGQVGEGNRAGDKFTITPKERDAKPIIEIRIERNVVSAIDRDTRAVIPEEHGILQAFLERDYGVKIPFTYAYSGDDYTIMQAALPANFRYPLRGLVKVSSGIGISDGLDTNRGSFSIEINENAPPSPDQALVGKVEKDAAPGGILLDPANMNMKVDKDAVSPETVPAFLPAGFDEKNFPGFYWNTINIRPVLLPALPELLGLDSPMDKKEKVDVSLRS